MAAKKKAAARKVAAKVRKARPAPAPAPVAAVHSPALEALIEERRRAYEADRALVAERVAVQEARLARIKAEAIAANPPRVRVTPDD